MTHSLKLSDVSSKVLHEANYFYISDLICGTVGGIISLQVTYTENVHCSLEELQLSTLSLTFLHSSYSSDPVAVIKFLHFYHQFNFPSSFDIFISSTLSSFFYHFPISLLSHSYIHYLDNLSLFPPPSLSQHASFFSPSLPPYFLLRVSFSLSLSPLLQVTEP